MEEEALTPYLIDTHCHLDAVEFDADRDALVAAAKVGAGRTALMVIPAIERANFGAVASVCREYPGCAPAYGIHPMYVDRARLEDLDALREILKHGPAVAIGEIGLDRHVEPRDDERQMFYFTEQLKLAGELGLPVLLHVRRAIDPILQALRQHKVPGGIAHAFNGSREQADAFIKLGFKLGFGGAMTYPGSKRIRELASCLPLESIVLETDAPDIPPAWKSGGRNTPADLLPIAETLAELRALSLAEVAIATSENALAVLPRLKQFTTNGEKQ
ncbi:MAG: TatD family hydrolase [Rhodocyclaceae bacterium]|nr:TatD family hydrolase [Rhodocyclaceae bacterium]MDZ4216427.1 TatD family hydrolase [Rhodocyclaceae bacterium]